MKKIFFLIIGIISISISAQKTIEKELNLSNGTTKNVKIYIPKNYDTDTIHKYPTAIVLNDQYLFDLYKGNAKLYADVDLAPRQIVVGIPTDYGTNKDVSLVKENLGLTKNSKVFYNFIKETLLPYIKKNYKTSPFTSIVGQGNAASFLTSFLREEKPIFNASVCITPHLTEKSNVLLSSYNLQRLAKGDNTYFLYTSHSSFDKGETQKAFNQRNTGLTSFENDKLLLRFDSFKNSPNKISAISESVPRAFDLIFKMYRNISKEEFEEKIKDLEPLEAIKYLEQRYIDLEYLYGTNLNVRLEDFYAIEGIVTDQMDGDYLRVLGDFAMIKHPTSPLGEYYVGKFHELGKDYKQADFYYKLGYGKMDPSDPNADAFYKNIERITSLAEQAPKEEPLPEEENLEEEQNEEKGKEEKSEQENTEQQEEEQNKEKKEEKPQEEPE